MKVLSTSPSRSLALARLVCALFVMLACPHGVLAQAVRSEHVEAELVAERSALTPGVPVTIALRLKLAPGWHTYWQNPGDSGLPTTLAWKLPDGITAGPIQWPAPRVLHAGPLVNYGYEGEVLHLVEINPSATLATGQPTQLAARADWLVCRQTCIPEGADLTLTLPVSGDPGPASKWASSVASARGALPVALTGWQVSAIGRGPTIDLELKPPTPAVDPGELHFFAFEPDRIEPSRPQLLTRNGDAFVMTLPVSSALAGNLRTLSGVITGSRALPAGSAGGGVRAAIIDVPVVGAVTAGPRPELAAVTLDTSGGSAAPSSLAVALGLALVGGLFLNLMPCVFPVLSLKVLGFAREGDGNRSMRTEAVAFACGVLLTFVALGLVLSGLRAAGEQIGWGFQLQSPAVVSGLAMLFFVLALNLSGLFEFGQLVPSGIANWTSRNRALDAFGSGVLAVIIASPCTAPFMGAALGYALTGSALTTLLVFVALGIGMALPYVLLAWFPAWRKRLPRPGPWLLRMKQLLAFPLYGTVIWLAWVLGIQRDNDAVLRLLLALLVLAFMLWAWHLVRMGAARAWSIAGVLALGAGALIAAPLFMPDAQNRESRDHESADPRWGAYSPAKLAELTAAGRTVFVDFTAAWCVTCQVNKRLVLDSREIRSAFDRGEVALLRADWTRRDPEITAALAALGRNGVPVYVLHRPQKAPQLLPEILTRQIIRDALAG